MYNYNLTRYTVTTRLVSVLRQAAKRALLMLSLTVRSNVTKRGPHLKKKLFLAKEGPKRRIEPKSSAFQQNAFSLGQNRLTLRLKCCFTSTETVGLLGTGDQDGHLDFHTAPELWYLWTGAVVECCFTSTETVGLLGTGDQDGHLDFHTAPELSAICPCTHR